MKTYEIEFLYTTYHSYSIDPETLEFSWADDAIETEIDVYVRLKATAGLMYENVHGWDIEELECYVANDAGAPMKSLPFNESRMSNIDYDMIIETGVELINDREYEREYAEH